MEKISAIIYSALMNYETIDFVLGAIILALFILQITLHLALFGKIASFRLSARKTIRQSEPPISVVIPLFGEDIEYLDNGLVKLLTQDYKDFEVVLVYVGKDRDFFADISSLQRLYPHLSPVHIDYSPNYPVSTKIALNIGIKSAKNECIIISTSDTTPDTERWVSLLAKGFLYGDIVIGYCGVKFEAGFANFIFRAYRYADSIAWLSAAIRRKPYSAHRGVLGFTKELYFGVRGFNHLNMNIGEDDLFLQQIATSENTSVVLSPRAYCSERTWGGWSWWWYRTCELRTTHRYYPKSAMVPTFVELLSRTLLFALVAASPFLLSMHFYIAALVMLLIRALVVLFITIRNSGRLGEKSLVGRYLIFDLIEPILRLFTILATGKKEYKAWS